MKGEDHRVFSVGQLRWEGPHVAVVSEHAVEEFTLSGGTTEQLIYVCIGRGI